MNIEQSDQMSVLPSAREVLPGTFPRELVPNIKIKKIEGVAHLVASSLPAVRALYDHFMELGVGLSPKTNKSIYVSLIQGPFPIGFESARGYVQPNKTLFGHELMTEGSILKPSYPRYVGDELEATRLIRQLVFVEKVLPFTKGVKKLELVATQIALETRVALLQSRIDAQKKRLNFNPPDKLRVNQTKPTQSESAPQKPSSRGSHRGNKYVAPFVNSISPPAIVRSIDSILPSPRVKITDAAPTILRIAGAGVSVAAPIMVLTGCGSQAPISGVPEVEVTQDQTTAPQPTTTSISEYTPASPNEPIQIVGEFPGEYSDFIRESGLIPKVIPEGKSAIEKVHDGIEYLRKFRDALRIHPDLRGEALSAYGFNSPNNFPIAVPDSWTIYNVIDAFLEEYDKGMIILNDSKKTAGMWSSNFHLRSGLWERTLSTVHVDSVILDNNFYTELEGYYYVGLSDLNLALVILHEYVHGLQEQQILNVLNTQFSPNQAELIITDPIKWSEFLNEYKLKVIDHVINSPPAKSNAQIEIIKTALPNEAQATGIAFMMFWQLKQLNNSDYFPGAGLYDIKFEDDMQRMRELYAGYWQNFFELYKRRVLVTNNALDAEWLTEGTMREYPDQ